LSFLFLNHPAYFACVGSIQKLFTTLPSTSNTAQSALYATLLAGDVILTVSNRAMSPYCIRLGRFSCFSILTAVLIVFFGLFVCLSLHIVV